MWRDPAEKASLSALSRDGQLSGFSMCDVAISRAGPLGLKIPYAAMVCFDVLDRGRVI